MKNGGAVSTVLPEPGLCADYAAAGYNRIALCVEMEADLTPLDIFAVVSESGGEGASFLLESGHKEGDAGRFSVVGYPARTVLSTRGQRVEVRTHGVIREHGHADSPLQWVQSFIDRFKPAPQALPFRTHGGLYGYIGYEVVADLEPILTRARSQPADDMGLPDIHLILADRIAVVDHRTGKLFVVRYLEPERPGDSYAQAAAELRLMAQMLREAHAKAASRGVLPRYVPPETPVQEDEFVSSFDRVGQDYRDHVTYLREQILAGEAFQVVLAQRLACPITVRADALYRAIRLLNPTPYMYLFDFGDYQVAGSSPERLVRISGRASSGEAHRTLSVHPIAGTRRRGRTRAQDDAFAQELLADQKEIAEHIMLVDLARNDVGRVANTGTVRVRSFLAIQRYTQVMHLASTVDCEIGDDVRAYDAIRATFPAGTLSGAPKVRAMQFIAELEPVRRGPYGGGVGYFGFDGSLLLAICIRTAIARGDTLYVSAGAGIVADSDPELEQLECINKARSVMRAVRSVQTSLNPPL